MSSEQYLNLQHVSHIGQISLMSELEGNLKSFLDWTLLRVGAWQDVNIPSSGVYGGDFSTLRLVDDEYYTDGQVWEGIKKDWVWESGVNYVDATGGTGNPIDVGIPEVDGVPVATGTYSVNYPLGRIVFDTAVSTSSTVKMAHSFRHIQTYTMDSAPWFQQLQSRSYRTDDTHFSQTSGNWEQTSEQRVQMPAVVIESISRGGNSPYEIGGNSMVVRRDVKFHVFAETKRMRDKLLDILSFQSENKSMWLFNSDEINRSGQFPLNISGERVNNINYPDFVSPTGYRWKQCWWENSVLSEVETANPNLYRGTVTTTFQIII